MRILMYYFSDNLQRLPHLLLYGPPGTGKTSTVLALARRIYGAKNMRQMVLELNASDDRGIDVVREQIKTFASTFFFFFFSPGQFLQFLVRILDIGHRELTRRLYRHKTNLLDGTPSRQQFVSCRLQIDCP